MVYALLFSVALILTVIFTPLAIRLAPRIGAIDYPDDKKTTHRKIHHDNVPRFGGLSIFIGLWGVVGLATIFTRVGLLLLDLWLLYMIAAAASLMFAVGVVDDIWGVKSHVKLIWQIIAASLVISCGVSIDFLSNPFNGLIYLAAFAFPLTLFWMVGITNSINLIDGLDGLAAGVVGISATTLLIVSLIKGQSAIASLLLAALSGVSFGFLFFNFNPALIFLGDSGSLLLGFLLAICSVIGALKSTLFVVFILPVLVLAVPILDTFLAIVRRAFLRKHIFQADEEHIHHRLLRAGFSHREAVIAIYVCCLLLSLIALILVWIL